MAYVHSSMQTGVDWRIDVKNASERGRMNVPTVLVQLQVHVCFLSVSRSVIP